MIVWTLLPVLLVGSAIGTPLRDHEDDGKYGYKYDVKHPGGRSQVHVRAGSDRNRNHYPSSLHHGDYLSESSYNDPTYVGPVYRHNRDRHYPKHYHGQPSYGHTYSKVPVYEEHSYPKSPFYGSASTYGHSPAYDRDSYRYHHNPGVISQSNIDAGSLYKKPVSAFDPYSKPQYVQQVSVDEPIPDKFEQVSLEPISQKTLSKDYSGPSSYPLGKSTVPSYNKYEQSPIEQQVVIQEQSPIDHQVPIDEQSPIDQQVIVEEPSPIGQKVFIDEQSPIDQKVLTDEQSPIDQQVILDEQSPIDQKVIVEEQSPIDQKVIVDEQSPLDKQIVIEEPEEIILQKPVDDKPELSQISVEIPSIKSTPELKGAPIAQQSYVANEPPVVQQITDDDPYSFTKKSPITQKTIGHPSQAVYDSPIEPSFSDVDRHAPPQSYKAPPRYRIVPTGPPYEKISHFTKIIHAPPRRYYAPRSYLPPRGYPQKHTKTSFPVYKKPPLSYHIKYPPPPPPPRPVTKTVYPINRPYSQKTVNPYTKNPPFSPSVKLPPPPPVTKTIVPSAGVQYHIDPPISQSIKSPPPPVTKTVVPAAGVQYHVDPPISQSIKSPPPPITKSIKSPVSQVQEHVDIHPVSQSVKSPPPAPVTKTFTPHQQEHVDDGILLTKNVPVSQSVKLPPPPAPITKTLIQADLSQAQEQVDIDIPTKNLPYSPPVTKTVVAAPVSYPQQYVDDDVLSKKSPVSVKLPPPPVTKSVASVKLPPPPVTKSVASVKLPPPPATKSVASVKLPPPPVTKSYIPPKQESIDDDIVSKKYLPISQSVKTPSVSQVAVPVTLSEEQKYVDIPSTKNAPYSVKQPPVQVYQPITFEKPTYVKEPYHGQKSIGSSHRKLPYVESYFNKPQYTDPIPPASYTVKRPYSAPPVLSSKHPHYSDSELHLYVPSTKTSPSSHGVKYPVVSNVHSVKQPVKSVARSTSPNTQHVNPHFGALISADKENNSPPSYNHPHSSSPQYQSKDTSYPEDGPVKKYTPDFDDTPSYPGSVHEEGFGSHESPDSPHFDEPAEEKSPFDKYPVSHAVRLPSIIPSPKVDSSSSGVDYGDTSDGIGESSPLDKHPPVSHSIILPLSPKSTPVPNLFAAVPPTDSHGDTAGDSEISVPKSEALISPVSHSVRLPLPIQGNNYKNHEKSDESKQKFPDFPVESAFNHPDPVADKVAELSNSFTPGEGYDKSNTDSNESDAPSIEEAKEEIERLNREIGRPFGSRLARRSNSGFIRIR